MSVLGFGVGLLDAAMAVANRVIVAASSMLLETGDIALLETGDEILLES